MTDFEQATETLRFQLRQVRGSVHVPSEMERQVDFLRIAHAVVVAERDSYRDVAHKLARYVLPDIDTLTIQQLVETADAVQEAAEEAADVD